MFPVRVDPPHPVPGVAAVYAENQPGYLPLPVWRFSDGTLVTRWRLTWRERLQVLLGRDLHLEVKTFNHPLQPLYLTLDGYWSKP